MNYLKIPVLLVFGAIVSLHMLIPAQSKAMPSLSGYLQQNAENGKEALSYDDLLKSGRGYFQTGEYAAAKKDFYKALKLAQDAKEEQHINQINFELAYLYNVIQQFDTAIILYRQVIDYYKEQEDTVGLGTVLTSYGSALYDMGSEDEAMKIFYRAVDFLKASGRYKNLGAAYENIAMINIDLGYERRGIQNYRQAVEVYRKMENPSYLISAYANLGVSYKNIQKTDSALYYYHLSDSLAGKYDMYAIKAQNLFNIGNIYYDQGKREKARVYYDQSLDICLQHDLVSGQYHNYLGRGENALEHGDAQQAIAFLTKAYNLARQNEFQNQGVLYELLAEAYRRKGDYQKAFFFSDQLVSFNDSVYQAQKHKELMELQAKYNLQKKEAQILELKTLQQEERLLRARIIIVSGSLFALALALFFWSRQRRANAQRRAAILEKENQQRADELEKAELDKKLKQKEAERYRLDLELKEQELVFQTLKQASIAKLNQSVKERLAPYTAKISRKKDQQDFQMALHDITHEVARDPLSDFEQMFAQMHDGFYEKLLEKAPGLSNSELQMCALLRMNMPSKEVAKLLNLAISTIDQRRHSIRQKLNLSNRQNLVSFLIAL